MTFKEWLLNLEGVFCKKGSCVYGGTVPTPSNRKPVMKVPTPRTAKIMRPHDKIHLYGPGGGPVSGGGGGGGSMSAPMAGGAAPAGGGGTPPAGGGAPLGQVTR